MVMAVVTVCALLLLVECGLLIAQGIRQWNMVTLFAQAAMVVVGLFALLSVLVQDQRILDVALLFALVRILLVSVAEQHYREDKFLDGGQEGEE